jgi:hypothetical protein
MIVGGEIIGYGDLLLLLLHWNISSIDLWGRVRPSTELIL